MINVKDIPIRDPFILAQNGVYYMLGTTGNDCWNAGSDLTLYRSTDLVSFEKLGTMIEKNLFADCTQVWAPELHYYQGKYYIIVSLFREDRGRGSMVFVADAITDKFQPLTGEYVTPKGWWCLDATLFVWKEKPYLIFSNEWINPITADGDGSLFVAALSSDLKEIEGKPRKIVSGKYCGFARRLDENGYIGYVAEGPYALEEDGQIALYWSTHAKDGYCVVKSKATDIFEEYVFEKFIFKEDGGHAMVFDDFSGKRKITFHQPNITPNERMKLFDL